MNFTFFSNAHGTFSRIDHILGHKSSLGKLKKKTEIIPSIFRLKSMLLNNQQITEEINKEIKICIEIDENENTTTQNLWDSVKVVLRGRVIAIQT